MIRFSLAAFAKNTKGLSASRRKYVRSQRARAMKRAGAERLKGLLLCHFLLMDAESDIERDRCLATTEVGNLAAKRKKDLDSLTGLGDTRALQTAMREMLSVSPAHREGDVFDRLLRERLKVQTLLDHDCVTVAGARVSLRKRARNEK